jgi:hypothetical protein
MTKNQVLAVGVVVLAVLVIGLWSAAGPMFGRSDDAKGGGSSHYSVVLTEGHNLLVTDNNNNQLYFYSKDKDAPIGSPLKLRASMDLSKVGDPEMRITPHNLEKFAPEKDK